VGEEFFEFGRQQFLRRSGQLFEKSWYAGGGGARVGERGERTLEDSATHAAHAAHLQVLLYQDGWRSLLPLTLVKAYPKLHALIQEWAFNQIVARLQGEIGDEIKRKEEPAITLYSTEVDKLYWERIGKEGEIEDSGGGEEREGRRESRRRQLSGGTSRSSRPRTRPWRR
jgi:hypothetical protein